MVIISKPLFYSKIGPEVRCHDLFHQSTPSCFKAGLKIYFSSFIPGVFFFYLPLYLLKFAIDYKKVNRKRLRSIVEAYLRSEMFGTTFGYIIISSFCLENKLFGRLHYYSAGFMSAFLAGASIFFESPTNRLLNTLIWWSLVIEALFKNMYYFRILNYSPWLETALFMHCSCILMYLLVNRKKNQIPLNIWFYNPPHEETLNNTNLMKDYFLEVFKYFGIGYGLSSAKSFISKALALYKKPIQLITEVIFNQKHIYLGATFAIYVGLFKGTLNILEKYRGSRESHAAIAGFLAGMAYYIRPTIQMLTVAVVTILQIIIKDYFKDSRLKFIPLTGLLYMISNGILFFNRLTAQPTCPKYYINMLKIASGGWYDQMYNNIINHYFEK